MTPPGFDALSTKIALVLGVRAARYAAGSVESTKWHVQPSFGKVCVNWVMEREPFDEVIVATPRAGRARLLRMDLAARIRRAFGIPVTHLAVGQPAPATA